MLCNSHGATHFALSQYLPASATSRFSDPFLKQPVNANTRIDYPPARVAPLKLRTSQSTVDAIGDKSLLGKLFWRLATSPSVQNFSIKNKRQLRSQHSTTSGLVNKQNYFWSRLFLTSIYLPQHCTLSGKIISRKDKRERITSPAKRLLSST